MEYITGGGLNAPVRNHVCNLINDKQLQMADLVRDFVSIRENTMVFYNGVICSRDELDYVIHIV